MHLCPLGPSPTVWQQLLRLLPALLFSTRSRPPRRRQRCLFFSYHVQACTITVITQISIQRSQIDFAAYVDLALVRAISRRLRSAEGYVVQWCSTMPRRIWHVQMVLPCISSSQQTRATSASASISSSPNTPSTIAQPLESNALTRSGGAPRPGGISFRRSMA